MKYTNLQDSPDFVQKAYNLIEDAFEYTSAHSFEVDFYPLMNKNNHQNCFLYIEGDEVVAHIGALERNFNIGGKNYDFVMFGGIAVNPKYRGQGIFNKLFTKVSNKFPKSTFHLLWSEKIDLYNKYDYSPVLQLNEYNKNKANYSQSIEKTKLSKLSRDEFEDIKSLYQKNSEIRMYRDEQHWLDLAKITSTDLFLIKESHNITNYFFL